MTSASIVNVPKSSANLAANAGNKTEGNSDEFVKVMSKSFSNVHSDSKAQTEAAKRMDSNVSQTSDVDDSNDTYKFEKKVQTKMKSQDESYEESCDKAKEAVDEFDSTVREELKEKLGISDEELDQTLEAMGLVIQDLMQPQNLVSVIGQITGNDDSLGMLLDENISSVITSVNDFVQNLTKEMGMDVPSILALSEQNSSQTLMQDVVSELQELGFALDDISADEFSKLPEDLQKKIQELQSEGESAVWVKTVSESDAKDKPVIITDEAVDVEDTLVSDEEDIQDAVVEVFDNSDNTQDESTKNGTDSAKEELMQRSFDEREQPQGILNSATSFTQTISSAEVEVTPSTTPSQIDVQRMITDIVDQAKVTITEEVKTMEMVLNPEHLGKLFMEVTAKDGQISARIYTENEAVKTALENQLVVLKENMNQQGMKIDSVEVSVGTHEFERNLEERASDQERRDAENLMQQDKNNQKNGRMRNIDLNNMDNLQGLMSEEEQLVAQIMKDNGNSVNYMA